MATTSSTLNSATFTAGRILCIADIRGKLSQINDLVREAGAVAVIHTGDFGFFEASSLDRINDRTLRHLTMYTPLIPTAQRNHLLSDQNPPSAIRATIDISLLSEFPLLLSGQIKLDVPVYTTWGACEDVIVLEKFRTGACSIPNLHVLDEAATRLLDIGGVKLRLFGIGGALVPHKMFDNGEGNATIAGGQGTMWTTALQIGELVDTSQKVFDSTETRLLVTHASPGREGLLTQLALAVKADLTISAGLHFRYATSYNEFSIQGDFEGFRSKLLAGKDQFDRVWDSVKDQVEKVIDDKQKILLDKALAVVEKIPPPIGGTSSEEHAWKNCWNWNLCDAAFGSLILDIREGRISAELKSQGFNYAYRRANTVGTTPTSTTSALPTGPSKGSTPAPPALAGTPPPHTNAVKANGAAASPTSATDKAERDRLKKKEKREKRNELKRASTAESPADIVPSISTPEVKTTEPATGGVPSSMTVPTDLSKASAVEDVLSPKSPATDGAGSTGARTPKGSKPARNPWTIFMRMSTPASEDEVRAFFGEAKSGITRVNFPVSSFAGKARKMAYVEFGDEPAMKAGLEKHEELLNGLAPEVKQATDRESREGGASYRGGPGGRGRGRGSGFAARGFAAAGLTRQGNGDTQTPKPSDGGA